MYDKPWYVNFKSNLKRAHYIAWHASQLEVPSKGPKETLYVNYYA